MTIEILTGILVLLTGYYAITTHRILRANEKAVKAVNEQNEALTKPYVHATLGFLSDAPVYVLKIKNHGKSSAKNLRLTVDREFITFGSTGKNIQELPAFSRPISNFSPDAELNYWLGTGPDIHSGENKSVKEDGFIITAEYEYLDKKIVEKTVIDFHHFLSSDIPRDDIAYEIKQLSKKVGEAAKKL